MTTKRATFDPQWLHTGKFDLSGDPRSATRTVLVRRALEQLEDKPFVLKPLPRRDHPSTYYLREGTRGEVEAQYYMNVNPVLRTLTLGLSVEKGEEHTGAVGDRRMSRNVWDWPNLVAMQGSVMSGHIRAISSNLGRPVTVVLDTHKENDDEERETVSFVGINNKFFLRSAPISIDVITTRIREIDQRKDWWADVWIAADFTETEVDRLHPEDVAKILYNFRRLRDALRLRTLRSRP